MVLYDYLLSLDIIIQEVVKRVSPIVYGTLLSVTRFARAEAGRKGRGEDSQIYSTVSYVKPKAIKNRFRDH